MPTEMPTETAHAEAIAGLIDELVLANLILSHQEVLDGFGHVSVRHPGDPEQFLIARSMAPDLVQRDDIVTLDLDGRAVGGAAPPLYLERYIHAELYRARGDVQAVVHSHAAGMLPFGVVPDATLRPLLHTCGFLAPAAPVFEIRDVAGDATDLLIRDAALGRALAAALGQRSVVLMRGHGFTAVGTSLVQAVYRAVFAEKNARAQADAMRLGGAIFLTDAEAAACDDTMDRQIGRVWELWKRQIAD